MKVKTKAGSKKQAGKLTIRPRIGPKKPEIIFYKWEDENLSKKYILPHARKGTEVQRGGLSGLGA